MPVRDGLVGGWMLARRKLAMSAPEMLSREIERESDGEDGHSCKILALRRLGVDGDDRIDICSSGANSAVSKVDVDVCSASTLLCRPDGVWHTPERLSHGRSPRMIAEFGFGDRGGESACGMTATAVTAVCMGIMMAVSERPQA